MPYLIPLGNGTFYHPNGISCSDAASGWAGWALAHPEFGVSVNPIPTRGADYAHCITASSPGFENLAASLSYTHFQTPEK